MCPGATFDLSNERGLDEDGILSLEGHGGLGCLNGVERPLQIDQIALFEASSDVTDINQIIAHAAGEQTPCPTQIRKFFLEQEKIDEAHFLDRVEAMPLLAPGFPIGFCAIHLYHALSRRTS